jgi:hypothetical protein
MDKVPYPTPDEFEAMSQQLAGYNVSTSEKIRRNRFVSFFGVEPLIVSIVWSMLVDVEDEIMVCFAAVDKVKPLYLLWALLFLKCYNINTRNAAIAAVDEKTYRNWSWMVVEAIANLDREVVSANLIFLIQLIPVLTKFLLAILSRSVGIIGWLEMMAPSLA